MIKYTLEESDGSLKMFLVDEKHDIKELIAVVFDKAHAKIIVRNMNLYVKSKTQSDPFLDGGIARVVSS